MEEKCEERLIRGKEKGQNDDKYINREIGKWENKDILIYLTWTLIGKRNIGNKIHVWENNESKSQRILLGTFSDENVDLIFRKFYSESSTKNVNLDLF